MSDPTRSATVSDTPARLRAAAVHTLVTRGIAGTSARTIAEAAGVSQGLVFYHYGSVNELLAAATREVTEQRATVYRDRLADVGSLGELADLARQLHDEERRLGNVAMVAQLLAGAHTHHELAPVARANFEVLAAEVRDGLARLLTGSVLDGVLPAEHLAHLVSAAFVGTELVPSDDDTEVGPEALFDTLRELADLVDGLLALGPTATAALRRRLSRES